MAAYLRHISEVDPRHRRLHVTSELHPGELTSRGYVPLGGEFALDLHRPKDRTGSSDLEKLLHEFDALRGLGYAFLEGEEWSPAWLFRKYREAGKLKGPFRAVDPKGAVHDA